jgi:HD-GYP domain-containing protein (c-di-GMP phosphodiesterase class II)
VDVTDRRQVDKEVQQRLAELELLNRAGLALSQPVDRKAIAETIIQLLDEKMDWHHTAVRLFHPQEGRFELLAFNQPGLTGEAERQAVEQNFNRAISQMGDGLSGWAMEHRQIVRSGDLSLDPRYAETFPGLNSGLYVPLLLGEQAIGVISIESEQPHAFTEADERLASTLAAQAASAFENARLYETALLSAHRRGVLYDAGQQMARVTQNMEELYTAIHQAVSQLMPAEAFTIVLRQEEANELEGVYLFDKGGRWTSQRVADGNGFSSQVIASGKTILISDLEKAPVQAVHFGTEDQIRSVLAVPLRSGDQVIGAISTQSYRPDAYSEEDRYLLEMLSVQAAISLDNVRLFNSVQHELSERKRVESTVRMQLERLTALREIDRAIISTSNVQLSLNILLSQTISLLGIDAGDILLVNPVMNVLEYAAGIGFRTQLIEDSQVRLGEGQAGQAALTRETVQVHDLKQAQLSPFFNSLAREEGFVRYVGVPLIAKGKVLGVLEAYQRNAVSRDEEWLDFLESLAGLASLAIDNAQSFNGLQRLNMELVMAYDATIEGWSRAMDLRDRETEGHTRRVTETTIKLAQRMNLNADEQVQLRRGALLHDIGKLGVPDSILLKPGKLTEDEWEIMKRHPVLAREMLSTVVYLRPAIDIPYCHHEKWDGTGYPRGLKEEQIPLSARIFAVVDVWDALTSDRPYRPAWTKEETLEYIREQSGVHFDPQVVEIFLGMISGG